MQVADKNPSPPKPAAKVIPFATTQAESNEISSEPTLADLIVGIKFYLCQIGQKSIEVGKRLIAAKKLVPHGDWQNWLDKNFNLKRQSAQNFMNIAERYSYYHSTGNLNQTQMVEMLALPAGDEQKFIDEKAAEGKDVTDMTIKELRQAIKNYVANHYPELKNVLPAKKSRSNSATNNNDQPITAEFFSKVFSNAASPSLSETSQTANPECKNVQKNNAASVDDLHQIFDALLNLMQHKGALKKQIDCFAKKDLKTLEQRIFQVGTLHKAMVRFLELWKTEEAKQKTAPTVEQKTTPTVEQKTKTRPVKIPEIPPLPVKPQTANLPKKTLSVDLETYCELDINTVGSYKYVENCDLLLCAYAFDDEPVQIVDVAMGEELPQEFVDALFNPNILKTAYNASFEIRVLSKYLEKNLDTSQWLCTMVNGLELGLPAGLNKIGEVLHLEEDKKKSATGKQLIKFFCHPIKSKEVLLPGIPANRNLPKDNLEKWAEFKEYCIQDVVAERAIRKKLMAYPLSDSERRLWCLDQKINQNGVLIDMRMVNGAIKIFNGIESDALRAVSILTNGLNAKSNQQMIEWIEKESGIKLSKFDKTIREKLLSSPNTPRIVRMVLEARDLIGKTSVKKYDAMLLTACSDNRARGMFQFYGANRTGRWAGRLIQLQNLPQNHLSLEYLNKLRPLVGSGYIDALKNTCGLSPTEILSQVTRTALIAEENHRFMVADFSAIEARIIAWFADEKWRMDVFKNGGDIYCASASEMFKVPVEKNGVNKELRVKGKVAELACGYGGGVSALKAFGADKLGLSDEDMEAIIKKWRETNPNICKLWRSIEKCAINAVNTGQRQIGCKGLVFEMIGDFLFITLPSGRKISYYKPRTKVEKKFSGNRRFDSWSLTYEGNLPNNGGWGSQSTWGGKIVENIVQATARDCLASSMLKLDEQGYKIVMHVHDEIICEMPNGTGNLDELIQIMCAPIDWAPGLLLNAEGYETAFYRKD